MQAVVLGGGLAGLLSAVVACKHFDRVVLLEKDELGSARLQEQGFEQAIKGRGGVPQFGHPHTLLAGRRRLIEELLPGFGDELRAQGGVDLDCLQDFYVHDHGLNNGISRGPSSLQVIGASRPLVEQVVRELAARQCGSKLELRGKARAEGLQWDKGRKAVTGVVLRGGEVVPADLVIDASGRFSHLPAWLVEAGWAKPEVQVVDSQICYVSRMMQLPEGWYTSPTGPKGVVIFGRPHMRRSGVVLPAENGAAAVGLASCRGEQPPMDEEGWRQFAASLPDPALHTLIQESKPLTPLIKYAGLKNALRCYHQVEMPAGIVAVGDAVLELNPVYGQGMSVAACGAKVLDEALGRTLGSSAAGAAGAARREEGLARLAASFQKELFGVTSRAWTMASSEDARYPGARLVGVGRPPWLLTAYIDAVVRTGLRHRPTYEVFFSVAHFVAPVTALFAPSVVCRVALQVATEAWAWLSSAAGHWLSAK